MSSKRLLVLLPLHFTSAFAVALKPSLASLCSGFRAGEQASAAFVVQKCCVQGMNPRQSVPGLGWHLSFPMPKGQKDLCKTVQPKPASGKLLNAKSPVFDRLPLTFPLAFKIRHTPKYKRKPLQYNEHKEPKSTQQELAPETVMHPPSCWTGTLVCGLRVHVGQSSHGWEVLSCCASLKQPRVSLIWCKPHVNSWVC